MLVAPPTCTQAHPEAERRRAPPQILNDNHSARQLSAHVAAHNATSISGELRHGAVYHGAANRVPLRHVNCQQTTLTSMQQVQWWRYSHM